MYFVNVLYVRGEDTPFGQLPILEVEGVTLGQNLAISRYLARKFGKLWN